jgi:hypothetical protein
MAAYPQGVAAAPWLAVAAAAVAYLRGYRTARKTCESNQYCINSAVINSPFLSSSWSSWSSSSGGASVRTWWSASSGHIMADYAAYVREQQQAQQVQQAAARPRRAATPDEQAGGGALMFGNRESTVERKQRIKGELRRMNGYNSQVSGQPNPAAVPPRASAAPAQRLPAAQSSAAAGARPGLPALQQQPPPPQQQLQPQQQQQQPQRIPVQAQAPMRRAPQSEPAAHGGSGPAAGVDDARFRALERQCVELREEQRQILGWLAKSEESVAAERASRERAEASLRSLLEQTLKAQEVVGEQLGGRVTEVYNELSERLQNGEQQQRASQGIFDRGIGALTDSISQLSSDLNSLSFFVASGGSLGGARVAEIARARGGGGTQS